MERYGGRQDLALRLYAWNLELTAAFVGPLSMLEVVLRNSMHDVLRDGRADDWWNTQFVHLAPREAQMLTDAINKLFDAGVREPTADDVVAATNFGFWIGLMDAGLARDRLYDYETSLWRPRLHKAFPHRGDLGRRHIHRQLNRVRKFRNRVMHNEPIFNQGFGEIEQLIFDCISLVEPEVAEYVRASHRIDEVVARKEASVASGECRI